MSLSIILPNYNLSLLQSQKHFANTKLASNKINISTQIIPSLQQNSLEIKLVVDSPFGQLQISNNLFIQLKDNSLVSNFSCQDILTAEVLPNSDEINKTNIPTTASTENGAIEKFLDIYAKANTSNFIGNNIVQTEECEEEEKQKSTAPNSPNQEKFSHSPQSSSPSSSPSSAVTILDEFQVENPNTGFIDIEMEQQCKMYENYQREKSLTILTQTSTTSLLVDDDSDSYDCNNEISIAFMKSEKKNSVKNVLKAFGNYISNMNEGQDDEIIELSSFQSVEDLKKRYNRYNKNQSYNNSLVSKIIQHQQYGIVFKHFINVYASLWLERSDVGDKASHETFIAFCKSACEDHELLNCLKIIKKKHLKLSSC